MGYPRRISVSAPARFAAARRLNARSERKDSPFNANTSVSQRSCNTYAIIHKRALCTRLPGFTGSRSGLRTTLNINYENNVHFLIIEKNHMRIGPPIIDTIFHEREACARICDSIENCFKAMAREYEISRIIPRNYVLRSDRSRGSQNFIGRIAGTPESPVSSLLGPALARTNVNFGAA